MQLLSLLSLLSVAVAIPVHSPRACFPDPTSFVVSRFVAFTASTGPNDTSAVTFQASDSTTGITTRCQRESTPGDGISPADPDHWYPCANPSMEFLWTGQDVGVRETYDACSGQREIASGTSGIYLICFPLTLDIWGSGTYCNNPTGFDTTITVTSVTPAA